jgi:cytochrome c oxidase subunit 2
VDAHRQDSNGGEPDPLKSRHFLQEKLSIGDFEGGLVTNDTRVTKAGRTLALVVWLIPVLAVAAGIRGWLPPVASEHGPGIDRMLQYLLVTASGMLVIAHLALGYILWRFGGQTRATFRLATPRQERNWSLVPIIVMALVAEGGVFVIGLPVWAKLYDAPPSDAITVELTAEQFAWNVRYPGNDGRFGRTDASLLSLNNPVGVDHNDAAAHDDVLLIGEVHLPVNRPARIRLRSKDVLHSFFLPIQRIKQDVVPGMTIEVWFVPTETGEFEIACAELCGFGHYQMRGLVRVESSQEFTRWLAELPTFD